MMPGTISPALFCQAGATAQLGASDRVRAALAGADADRFLDGRDEDLAVADPAGMRRVLDRLDRTLDHRLFHDDLDLHLGQEVDDVFGATVQLGMTLLPAKTLGLGHGDPLDPDFVKSLLHLIKLERLNDRLDLFHGSSHPPAGSAALYRRKHIACQQWRTSAQFYCLKIRQERGEMPFQ